MPKYDQETFGDCLRAARMDAGYTSRDIAQVRLAVSGSVQGRHERNERRPSVEDVLAYARAYQAPELLTQYCRLCCPIGCRTMTRVQLRSVAALNTRLSNRMRSIAHKADRLAEIADDDVVDDTERGEFDEIVMRLRELRQILDEYDLYAMQKKRPANRCERKSGSVQPLVNGYDQYYTAIGQ